MDCYEKKIAQNIKDVFYLFYPYWNSHRAYVCLCFLLIPLFSTSAAVGSALYQQTILNVLSEGKGLVYVSLTVLWLALIIYIPQLAEQIIDTIVSSVVITATESEVNKSIYRKARNTDYLNFDTPSFYDNFTWAVRERAGKAEESRSLAIKFLTASVTIFSMVGIMISQDWVIIVINIWMLITTTRMGFIRNRLTQKKREEMLVPERRLSYINRMFYTKEQAESIKVTRVGEKLLEQYDKSYNAILSVIKKYRWKLAFCMFLTRIVSLINEFGITIYLSYLIMDGRILIGGFIGMQAASAYFRTGMRQLFDLLENSNQLSYYAGRLRDFEQTESPIENGEGGWELPSEKASEGFEVEFRNVSFSYAETNFGIRNMCFHISSGQKVAIVGRNGVGKSTLTKLLLRLYDVQDGEILINGKNIKGYDVRTLRQHVGIALQDSQAYAMSFRDNLTLYQTANDAELMKICGEYGLNHVFTKTNASLDSQVTREFDEKGVLLSGGEKQRLALARLAVGDFGLLILDEPSSALDPLAEYEMNRIIFGKSSRTTTIMISHRFSNVREADCIYVMDQGEIVESGTHDQLMAGHGLYYEMFSKQSEGYALGIQNDA